jgi:hypothetical protein
MEKEFIPYQESLELRDLRFDEPCFGHYLMKKFYLKKYHKQGNGITLRPTYQQAFRFFREKFNLEYQIIKSASDSYSAVIHLNTREYLDKILTLYNACVAEVVDCYSYEEVELDCLRKLIEIVKNKSI